MNEFTVILKQHTPIIHFQHDQDGATLRASEVKPKLDEFLIKEVFNNDFNKCGKYLIGYNPKPKILNELKKKFYNEGYRALNYKIKFEIKEEPQILLINEVIIKDGKEKIRPRKSDGRFIKDLKPFPSFFGNMDKDIDDHSEYKKFSFLKNEFEMKIFSLNKELIDKIHKASFNSFFLENNFGTRQSKGFGSFYPVFTNHTELPNKDYQFEIQLDDNSGGYSLKRFKELFQYIDYFYKTLRSGINQPSQQENQNFYFKSLMFQYAKSKQEQWDKKTIRDKFQFYKYQYKEIINKRKGSTNGTFLTSFPSKKYIFRDLLGLSPIQEWKYYNDKITKSCTNVDENKKEIITRFKSPITFKIIEVADLKYIVYLILSPIDTKYLNSSFEVNSKSYKQRDDNDRLILNMYPKFSLNEYLDFALSFDISTCVNNPNHRIYRKYLNPIFRQFKIKK